MQKHKRLLLLSAMLVVAFDSRAVAQTSVPKAAAIRAPRPEYPFEARARHMTGRGIAILRIDSRTGCVTAVRIEKSTGHVIRDHAALSALMRWRFKPGTVPQLRIPINFTMQQPKT
jgi:TonB family protein